MTTDDEGEELRHVAYHEAGHAMVAELMDPPVGSVRIMGHLNGRSLGSTETARWPLETLPFTAHAIITVAGPVVEMWLRGIPLGDTANFQQHPVWQRHGEDDWFQAVGLLHLKRLRERGDLKALRAGYRSVMGRSGRERSHIFRYLWVHERMAEEEHTGVVEDLQRLVASVAGRLWGEWANAAGIHDTLHTLATELIERRTLTGEEVRRIVWRPGVLDPSVLDLRFKSWDSGGEVGARKIERGCDQELDEIVVYLRDRQYGADRERNPHTEFAPPPPGRVVDAVPVPPSDVPIEDQPTQLLSFIDDQPTQRLPGSVRRWRTTISLGY